MTKAETLLTALADCERLLRQERIAAQHAHALLRAMDVLHEIGAPEQGIGPLLEICRDAAAAELALLLRRDEDGGMATWLATDPGIGLPHWSVDADILMRVRRVTELAATPLHAGLPAAARGFRSLLSVPVLAGENPPMAIVLLASRPAGFSRHDVALMKRIAALLERVLDRTALLQRNAALARIVDSSPGQPIAPLFAESSFDTLNRAFARVVDWQGHIVDLTNDLLSARNAAVDPAIDGALARTGRLAGSDRTYVFRLRPPDRLDNTHEWVAEGIEPMIAHLQDMPADLLDEWRGDFDAGRPVDIPDVGALPEGSAVRDVLQMQGIRSLLAVPMRQDGRLVGFVGYDAVRAHRRFLPVEIQLLQSVANAIAAVMVRAEAEAEAARARLQHERDRFEATLAAIPDLVLELDAEGRFSGYVAGAKLAPAVPADQLVGRMPEEVLPPALARLTRTVLRQVDRLGHSHGHRYEMELDGEVRWFEVSAAVRTAPDGAAGYVFLIHDITESRRQQQQIRRLGRIAELTSNLVVVTDAQGRIDWVNPAFERRSGWRLDEVRGRKPGEFLQCAQTDAATVARIREALHKGQPVRAELLNRSRTGEDYWISKDIQPLTDDAGRLEGFVSVQTDITALQRSHQRALRVRVQAMDASSDGIAISSPNGGYVYMNPAHRRMFGIGPTEDIRKLQWQDLVTPEAAARFMEHALPELQASGSWQGEETGLHRDGRPIPLDLSLSSTESGGLLCIARDITERRELEAERTRLREDLQLAQRRETVAHLASGVAHDLNNLVAVVSGTVSLLEAHRAGNEDLGHGLTRIGRAMDAARDLVKGLGDIARPDAPRNRLDLRTLAAEAIDLLGTARVQQHRVRVDLPAVEQPVWANRTELLQVILNLAFNACEAGVDRPSEVTIRVGPSAGPIPARPPDVGTVDRNRPCTTLAVIDSGGGIDPAVRDRLFERYVTTKGSAGTGMGLPIVAGILRDNHAALWLDSIPGQGTTVTVTWPEADLWRADSACEGHAPTGRTTLSGHRILVVDDVADVADVLSEMLETDGAVTIGVSDPAEARELLLDNPGLWSALVTDLDMPGLDGAALAGVAAGVDPPVPCVLVTALPERAGVDRRLFRNVLAKPIGATALIAAVRAAIGAAA